MPVNTDSGEYEQDGEDDILDELQSFARQRFDFDPEEHDDAALTQFFATYAAVRAENTEQSLQDVFDASFVDTAEGSNLERVVRRIGVQRQPAVKATGVQRFESNDPVTSDHSIPSGTTVRTPDDTASFETDAAATLEYIDGFEAGSPLSNYSGDTGTFSVESTTTYAGSQALRGDGGSVGKILHDNVTITRGDIVHARLYLESGGAGEDEGQLLFFATSTASADHEQVYVNADQNTFAFRGSTSASPTVPKDEWLHVKLHPRLDGTNEAWLFDASGNELANITETPSDPEYSGQIGFGTTNGESLFDEVAMSAVAVDTTAVEAGSHGNVAADTLTVLDSTLSGVDSTTNPIPTGDSSQRDTSDVVLKEGKDRETDDELRDRAVRDDEGSLGTANTESLLDAVGDVESVSSFTVEQNKTDSTDGDGRPPHSFEVIVPSSANYAEVARAIYETKAHTDNDSGGHVGTQVTETVESDVHPSYSETISFTEASTQDVDMTLSIVVNDDYAGDDALRKRVVEYIGGTRPDGTTSSGLGLGEDVYVDELKERVMADEGVVGFDDSNTSFTPSTTTDSNGLTIIDVADTDIAECDGTDGSITISTTTV